ncbi:MAG: LptA/OstA family protein [Bradymonadia bacterium]
MNILVGVICVSALVLTAPAKPVNSSFQLSATKVDVDHQSKLAHLSGNVRLSWGEFRLRAGRVEIRYNDEGTPTTWRAQQDVQVIWRDRTIESHDLWVEQKADTFVFKGPLTLSEGQQRLVAKKVTYFVKSQRFVLEDVEGQINFQQLVKP